MSNAGGKAAPAPAGANTNVREKPTSVSRPTDSKPVVCSATTGTVRELPTQSASQSFYSNNRSLPAQLISQRMAYPHFLPPGYLPIIPNQLQSENLKEDGSKKRKRTNYRDPENASKLAAALNILINTQGESQHDLKSVAKMFDLPYNTLRDNYLKVTTGHVSKSGGKKDSKKNGDEGGDDSSKDKQVVTSPADSSKNNVSKLRLGTMNNNPDQADELPPFMQLAHPQLHQNFHNYQYMYPMGDVHGYSQPKNHIFPFSYISTHRTDATQALRFPRSVASNHSPESSGPVAIGIQPPYVQNSKASGRSASANIIQKDLVPNQLGDAQSVKDEQF